MKFVGLKVLKNQLSEYVRLAAGGETIFVTDRDKVVAELIPPRAHVDPFLNDPRLADALGKGWITPAANSRKAPPAGPAVMPLSKLLEELAEDRADR